MRTKREKGGLNRDGEVTFDRARGSEAAVNLLPILTVITVMTSLPIVKGHNSYDRVVITIMISLPTLVNMTNRS